MAVSFSGSAKSEICKVFPQKACCALAQCFGILLFCNSFNSDQIRIITESREFAQNLPKLFRKAFGVTFDAVPEAEREPHAVCRRDSGRCTVHSLDGIISVRTEGINR